MFILMDMNRTTASAENNDPFLSIPEQYYSYSTVDVPIHVIVDQSLQRTSECSFTQTLIEKRKSSGRLFQTDTSKVSFNMKKDFKYITIVHQPEFRRKVIVINFTNKILNYKQETNTEDQVDPYVYRDKRDFSALIFSADTDIDPYIKKLESVMKNCLKKEVKRKGRYLIAE